MDRTPEGNHQDVAPMSSSGVNPKWRTPVTVDCVAWKPGSHLMMQEAFVNRVPQLAKPAQEIADAAIYSLLTHGRMG